MADIGDTASIDLGRFSKALPNGLLPLNQGTSEKMSSTSFQRDDPPDRGAIAILENDTFEQRSISQMATPSVATVYFIMRGKDVDCGPLTYRRWVTENAPDDTGVLYDGPKCGASPLEHIVIEATR